MNLSNLMSNALKLLKSNSPQILTGIAVGGVIATSVLSAQAGVKAQELIDNEQKPTDGGKAWKLDHQEKIKIVWKCYIPPAIAGAVTIGCIVGSAKAGGRKTAAAITAYSLTEKAFSEYREKVVEQIGASKEQAIRDGIAQDKVNGNPPSNQVVLVGRGQVLCCELYTRRYFKSDMELLRRAENDINARIISQMYVTMEEFYDLIGIPPTSRANEMGWDSDKLLKLDFSAVISPDGEPCIAFDYNYTKPI